MTALVLSSSTFFGPLSNKSLEVLGSTSTDILWILYPFEEGIGGSKILSLGGYSMLSRNSSGPSFSEPRPLQEDPRNRARRRFDETSCAAGVFLRCLARIMSVNFLQ